VNLGPIKRTVKKRQEIKYQGYIIDSYVNCGGYAKKWASEWSNGNPDIIASLPGFGAHFLEAKHFPTMPVSESGNKNPMTELQKGEAANWQKAGVMSLGILVVGGPTVKDTMVALFLPQDEKWGVSNKITSWVPYRTGFGYDMRKLMLEATQWLNSKKS